MTVKELKKRFRQLVRRNSQTVQTHVRSCSLELILKDDLACLYPTEPYFVFVNSNQAGGGALCAPSPKSRYIF